MGNNNNLNHEYNDEYDNSLNWQDADEWGDAEDMIYAKKKHQNHRARNKNQVRRNIEDIKERKRLSVILGDDFDDEMNFY